MEGVWHTGIVIYGKEFYYGGGISYDLAGKTPFGQPTTQISLGSTEVPEEIFYDLLRDLATRFTDKTFNILTNNTNTFTNEVATLITD